MRSGRIAVGVVWALTALGVVLVVVLVPRPETLQWLALGIGVAVALGMAGQLAVADRSGFVVRLAASAVGSFVLIAVGALVAAAGA